MQKILVYADNAATTQLDSDAFEAMKPYLLSDFGNASQPYSFARSPKMALRESRQIIASCINAEPDEIFFTSGGTESDNWAIKGIAFASQSRKTTITSAFEHHAVLRACKAIERLGWPVAYLSPTVDGIIEPGDLEAIIAPSTALVSVMMSNNEIGTVQPIRELCHIAHKNGALFHTDAVQAVGHIPVDVKELDIDLLSASAHKFNGPKGVGFLYIKKGVSIAPLIDGGSQEYGYRAGTENVASIIGMAVSLKNNCVKLKENMARIVELENELLNALDDYQISYVRNGKGRTIPGNLSLSFVGHEGESLLHRLDLMGIQVSTGSACDSKSTQISHVLQAIRTDETVARGTIRISLGKESSLEDVGRIAAALKRIL